MKTNKFFILTLCATALIHCNKLYSQVIGPFTQTFFQGGAPVDSLGYVTPGVISSSTLQYNIIQDTTGTQYTGGAPPMPTPTDLFDITIQTTNIFTANPLAVTSTTNDPATRINQDTTLSFDPRLLNRNTYSTTVGGWTNNPGHVLQSVIEVRFASHIIVSDLTARVTSLNTAGICWEYGMVQFLDQSMNPFNPVTGVPWTLGATSQYFAAGSGFTGLAGAGNYVVGSTASVINVGTAITTGGTDGFGETGHNYTSAFMGVGGSRIGGFRIFSWLEDVRGSGNAGTNFNASLTQFTITYTIPEPKQAAVCLLLVFVTCIVASRLHRRKIT